MSDLNTSPLPAVGNVQMGPTATSTTRAVNVVRCLFEGTLSEMLLSLHNLNICIVSTNYVNIT